MVDKIQKIREWVKARLDENASKQSLPQFYGMMEEDARFLDFIDSLKEESATSLWHDASEKAEKGKLYLYRTNQNVVDINRSDGKEFPDYCERWAYIDDLFKL